MGEVNTKTFISAIVLAILALLIKQPMLVLFPIFLLVYSFKTFLQKASNKLNISLLLKLVLILMLAGVVTEGLAITNNAINPGSLEANPNALFDRNPIKNILIGWGHYISFALIWFFVSKRYKYSIRDVFLLSGIIGIILESKFAVLLSLNPILYIYAFLVHSSYVTLAFIIIEKDPFLEALDKNPQTRRESTNKRFVVAFTLMLLSVIPVTAWNLSLIAIFKAVGV